MIKSLVKHTMVIGVFTNKNYRLKLSTVEDDIGGDSDVE